MRFPLVHPSLALCLCVALAGSVLAEEKELNLY